TGRRDSRAPRPAGLTGPRKFVRVPLLPSRRTPGLLMSGGSTERSVACDARVRRQSDDRGGGPAGPGGTAGRGGAGGAATGAAAGLAAARLRPCAALPAVVRQGRCPPRRLPFARRSGPVPVHHQGGPAGALPL